MAKSLEYLKTHRAKHGESYEHNGNTIEFFGETMNTFSHYKLYPFNIHGLTRSKQKAIHFLETN